MLEHGRVLGRIPPVSLRLGMRVYVASCVSNIATLSPGLESLLYLLSRCLSALTQLHDSAMSNAA